MRVLLLLLGFAVCYCWSASVCAGSSYIASQEIVFVAQGGFNAFPGEENSLSTVTFSGTCPQPSSSEDQRSATIEKLRATQRAGVNTCYANGQAYEPTNATFPACGHLSGLPNCRMGPNDANGQLQDMDKEVMDVLCQYQGVFGSDMANNKCFKSIQRVVCSLFDPGMTGSPVFFHHYPMTTLEEEDNTFTAQRYLINGDQACDVLPMFCTRYSSNQDVSSILNVCKGPLGSNSMCQSSADCTGFQAGYNCVASASSSGKSVCVAPRCDDSVCVSPNSCQYMDTKGDVTPITTDDDVVGSHRLEPGMIALIAISSAFTLYCVVGFMYKRFVQKATGRDQIPNVEFWSGLGRCCGNLCTAVLRCKCRRNSGGYSAGSLSPPPYDWT